MIAAAISIYTAMVFDYSFGAGFGVQTIDILRDDTDALPCRFQLSHFLMDNVGLVLTGVKDITIVRRTSVCTRTWAKYSPACKQMGKQ